MVAIYTSLRQRSDKDRNDKATHFSFTALLEPVMSGLTLAIGDAIPLITVGSHQVLEIYQRHFGTNETDVTLSLDFTYAPLRADGKLFVDAIGDAEVVAPNYFAAAVTYAAAVTEPASLQRLSQTRLPLSVTDGLIEVDALTGLSDVSSYAVTAVVVAIPTGPIEITFSGSTRSY